MGLYGNGYLWHKLVPKFPDFPFVTKTITCDKKIGIPFAVAFLPFIGKSTWNRTSLYNPGIYSWIHRFFTRYDACIPNMILSITGSDYEIQAMCSSLDKVCDQQNLAGIEINMSCPNVKQRHFNKLPETKFPLYLKVRHDTNIYNCEKDFSRIKRIHLNSVPGYWGGMSGEYAKKYNWKFINKYQGRTGIPEIAGASWTSHKDINRLQAMGCKHVGIGSQILTMPNKVRGLEYVEE